MKVLVLGAGVVGVTTAYLLGARGFDVEVIERQAEPGRETSFANGGQLSYSHAEPWANPSVLPKVFKWMFKDDAPLVMRPRGDLDMITWCLRFLRNCTVGRARANSVTMLRLGLYSKKKMEQLRTYTGIDFHHYPEGILHIYSDELEFKHAVKQAKFQEKFNCTMEICTPARCIEHEPTLEHAGKKIVGGIHQPFDESGDIFAFTQALASACAREHGTRFHYNKTIRELRLGHNGIGHVITSDAEVFSADKYVLCLGSYSPLYLRQIGIRVPIYPMKGYSITLPADIHVPKMSLTDTELKLVYSRFGDKLRVAGTAEFAGYDTEIHERRVTPIHRAAQALFPQADLKERLSSWACLRPQTPDGPPIIGKTKYPNLFLNTGHGTLGWTQAAGSAALIADIVEDRPTEISLEGLSIERYS